ncbi:MAG: PBP1A family penicillin-binding protein [Rhodospirillales bacterium]|nr:PBP1A family penicillin-binding protein [Rhodospirillales bacterium]
MGKVRKNKGKRAPAKDKAKAKKPTPRQGGGLWCALTWIFKKSLKWGAVAGVWAVIVLSIAAAWYATDLPDVEKAFNPTRRPTVTLLAADGGTLMTIGDVYGAPKGLDALPKTLVQAVLATEDRRFYSHFGLDVIGLARAMVANIRAGRIVQGGSTITQQVAKNLFLTPARTVKRKVQELMLALWLEHKFSKDQILTLYLNRVYLGSGTYGVDAAAQKYFGRPVAGMSTYEAATLAGMLKGPNRYNPLSHPKRSRKRTALVLQNMVAAGHLSKRDAGAAKRGTRTKTVAARPRLGPYFADWVMEQVSDYVNPGDRDLVVKTTLDANLQALAEAGIERALARRGRAGGISEAALVTMTPWGAVRAMVGGRHYAQSQFNRATQARRQPGSAFKPFVYLAGLESGLRPETVMNDEPVAIGKWQPRNFSKTHIGPVSLKTAMAKSINTIAVKVAERAGRGRVIDIARRFGLSADFKPTPSLSLGVQEVTLLELTAAYGPFANGGAGVWAYGIVEITDSAGNVLYRRGGDGPGRVVGAPDVGAMNAMLSEVVSAGTGQGARINRPQAGKTGTSQNFRDAWFIGYTGDLVAGVWMGNDNGARMKKVTGGGAPAILWRDFMKTAHQGLPLKSLPGLGAPPVPADNDSDNGQGFWKSIVGVFGGGQS